MESRELLEELHLALEGAVDQMTRAQRLVTAGVTLDVADVAGRMDRLFAEIAGLRNDVREALMRELARGPRKLPVV